MNTTQKLDTLSAAKLIETTSFDSDENHAGREYLRAQMDDAARAKFDVAVSALRESLDAMSPADRAAYRGFSCEPQGGRPGFIVNLIFSNEVKYSTDATPPAWAVEFCKRDLEYIRQFHLRFLGATEEQCPPLPDEKLVGQAAEIAKAFPDEHHARANMWRNALGSLSPEQEGRLVFPENAPEDRARTVAASS